MIDDNNNNKEYVYIEKPKRNGKYSKVIVILVIVSILVYTSLALFISFKGGIVPDSLTYSFFGALTGELLALAGIKIVKKKGE